MQSILFSDIEMRGELAVRAGLNYARLEGKWYRPDEVFTADQHGWPADWEGRVILALTLLAQSTHRPPAYLEDILERMPKHLNKSGYLGVMLPEGQNDEQQLAGHSWLMRGLLEYATWKKTDQYVGIAEGIVKNLFVKASGYYRQYPLDPKTRYDNPHWRLSKLQTKTKHHAETSDCGCAFIPTDGITHAYQFFKTPALKALSEEVIETYSRIDFDGLHVQTHATLSACRGTLRMYEIENDPKYLQLAIRIFELYKSNAWTGVYGNYNWFGHPRWTEPCGIIDSFIVATTLWKHTGQSTYLEDAHHIYYNALCHAHRENGSFGTDRCVGAVDAADNLFLTPINFETYWCCTMRGGEGFSRAIEFSYFLDGDTVYVPFYNSSKATLRFADGAVTLEQKTNYPYEGGVHFKIVESATPSVKTLRFFMPSWTTQGKTAVHYNGQPIPSTFEKGFLTIRQALSAGAIITFDLGLAPFTTDLSGSNNLKDCFTFRYGPMILGLKCDSKKDVCKDDNAYVDFDYLIPDVCQVHRQAKLIAQPRGCFGIDGDPMILRPLCDVRELTTPGTVRQILFKE